MSESAGSATEKSTMKPEVNKLLVVDDDVNNRAALVRRLVQRGYVVEVAEDGQRALDKILSERYSLILLDQMMPGMSGIELLRLLRGTYSETDLPVIMVTGIDHPQAVTEALRRGANDYLVKPTPADVVAARIDSQLLRSKTDHAMRALDPLTGLGNRASLFHRMANVVMLPQGPDLTWVAMLFLDLDGFKAINDSFGTAAGDQVLTEIGGRIRAALAQAGISSGHSMVARISADEFAILLENVTYKDQPTRLAKAVLATLGTPHSIGSLQVVVTGSIGIAMSPDPAKPPEELLQEADMAMQRAKELGKNRSQLFDPVLRERAKSRMSTSIGLRGAVERQEMVAMYQPEVNLKTGKLVGFECLLRWRHPERGLLLPQDFISIAEDTGLIIPIGEWVLDHAVRQLKEWQTRFRTTPALCMNVNLSVKQLMDANLVDRVKITLSDVGIVPETLKLELTESILMSELETVKSALSSLEALKIGLELDDFGTGYSSLSYLRTLHFTSLKIDRTWVDKLLIDSETYAIVEMIVHLAHKLKMTVVAEGIQTQQQVAELAQIGCDAGQGYYFSPPMTAVDAEKFLAARLS